MHPIREMNLRTGKTYALLFLTLALPIGARAQAQDAPRTLSGSVTDAGHEPLRGAVVQLEDQNTHSIVSYITDKTGRYSFKRIGANTDYSVWATFRGQKSKPKSLDKFDPKKNPELDLVIELQ